MAARSLSGHRSIRTRSIRKPDADSCIRARAIRCSSALSPQAAKSMSERLEYQWPWASEPNSITCVAPKSVRSISASLRAMGQATSRRSARARAARASRARRLARNGASASGDWAIPGRMRSSIARPTHRKESFRRRRPHHSRHVPHLERAVPRAGDDLPAVGGDRHVVHRVAVPDEAGQLGTRRHIPHARRAVA